MDIEKHMTYLNKRNDKDEEWERSECEFGYREKPKRDNKLKFEKNKDNSLE